MKKTIEGEIAIEENEGGFCTSSVTIRTVPNDIWGVDFSRWLAENFDGDTDTGRCGIPDQKLEGRYRITVERIGA